MTPPGFSHNFADLALRFVHLSALTGYILTVGCVSFAVCYKHGPLVEERSVVLLAWLLRLLSLLLVYMGVSAPQFACTAALLLFLSSGSRCYPRSVLACVGRYVASFLSSIISLMFWALVLFILWGNFLDTSYLISQFTPLHLEISDFPLRRG